MATAKMLNLQRTLERMKKLPEMVKQAVGTQLAGEVEDLTEAIQRAAPVNDLDQYPGQLRDSVHFYPNPDRPLSYRILADAKDDKGKFIGSHVEHGHKARDGSHVPRVPFFFPTYRARKKAMRRRISAAGRKAIKAEFPTETK
jgi:hypothetical protein